MLNPNSLLGFKHQRWSGPAEVRTEVDAKRLGINCVALAHLAINQEFGVSLPASLHCWEMFNNHDLFTDVLSVDDLRRADLFWFGPDQPDSVIEDFRPIRGENGLLRNWGPIKHVAIYTGQRQGSDPLLLHATKSGGTEESVIWPLSEFAGYPRYGKVFRISRLVPELAYCSVDLVEAS